MNELKVGATHMSGTRTGIGISADAMGSGDMEVFATPAMVALMENAAMNTVAGSLDEGYTTVGTFISVSHVKATGMGEIVTARATLTEVDGRSLTFDVEASDRRGVIGRGVHKRFVVEREKFMGKVQSEQRK